MTPRRARRSKALTGVPRCRDLLEQVRKVAKNRLRRHHLAASWTGDRSDAGGAEGRLAANIRLDREVPFDLRPVAISAGDIDRMLVMFLQNGCDAMKESGTLAVQAGNVAIEADSARVRNRP